MVTHHGKFKVAVRAVCQWETEKTRGGGLEEGRRKETEVRQEGKKMKMGVGEKLNLLENQNKWVAGN